MGVFNLKNKFVVINAKMFLFAVIGIFTLILACGCGNTIVEKILETAANYRLLPIYSVETEDKVVALTFDCAWGADDIPDIINTLTENDVKAAFFMVGDFVKKYPDEVKLVHDNGMDIGNHSNSHAHVNALSFDTNVDDMKKCNEKIMNITGEEVKLYRGPYGEYNNTVIEAAKSLEMQVVQWDIDTLDYTGKTPDEMCKRIKDKIRNGSIILMHNDTKHTAEGLNQIIRTIKDLGYEIVPVSEMIYQDNYEINHEGRQILKVSGVN